MTLFVHDPQLKALALELCKALRSGRMKYSDALEAMKKAIRHAIEQRGTMLPEMPSS